jgi:hypothetical protein
LLKKPSFSVARLLKIKTKKRKDGGETVIVFICLANLIFSIVLVDMIRLWGLFSPQTSLIGATLLLSLLLLAFEARSRYGKWWRK